MLDALQIDLAIPVAQDASGPGAINWALDQPERVSALVLLNTYYGQAPTLHFPEFISLFADPAYATLSGAMAQEPTVAQWLLAWQGRQFGEDEQVLQSLLPIIEPQFAGTPGTFPPFIGLTSNLHATVQANTQRTPDLGEPLPLGRFIPEPWPSRLPPCKKATPKNKPKKKKSKGKRGKKEAAPAASQAAA